MSRIDQRYEFRLAGPDDIESIMAFYREEWSADHLLATDRDYFRYQHLVDGRVNFMLGIERDSGEIHAAEGFIQYSKPLCDVGAVMWKVGSRCRTPMLGVSLVQRLKEATACRVYLGPGANPRTAVPLHRQALGHCVGRLDHYYMLGETAMQRIAQTAHRHTPQLSRLTDAVEMLPVDHFEDISDRFDFDRWRDRKPFKDGWYVNHRYFANPIYSYRVFVLHPRGDLAGALLVTREVEHAAARILRIVDVIGDPTLVARVGKPLQSLLHDEGFEYVDLYCKGIDRHLLESAGFTWKDPAGPDVIPNFFEPFVQANVDIWYSLSDDDTLLFKADGDQDRPNARPQRQPAGIGKAPGCRRPASAANM